VGPLPDGARLALVENSVIAVGQPNSVEVGGGKGEVQADANVLRSGFEESATVVSLGRGGALAHALFSNNQVYCLVTPSPNDYMVDLHAEALVVIGNYVADLRGTWGAPQPVMGLQARRFTYAEIQAHWRQRPSATLLEMVSWGRVMA
jgi:hypothetical protein